MYLMAVMTGLMSWLGLGKACSMKPSEQCKAAGLRGLVELQELTGESKRNLINWNSSYPARFQVIIDAALYRKRVERL